MKAPPAFFMLLACALVCSVRGSSHSAGGEDEAVVVYVIPHSHCDAGYKMTFDQYYEIWVQFILDTMTNTLHEHPDRKFVWSEISYLRTWWEEKDERVRANFKALVDNKQIEFVNGGWVMHDEAITTVQAQLIQQAEGHAWIRDAFGPEHRVRYGWQIDPFGASASSAAMMAMMGYDGLIINRIPFYLNEQMKRDQTLEFVWRTSRSLNANTTIFTHVLDDHYSSPPGFDFQRPLDNPPITDENVANRSVQFVEMVRERASYYRTNRLLIPFGSDFEYVVAYWNFENMDRIISYLTSHTEFNVVVKYATLSDYFGDVNNEDVAWPSYSFGDFLPYDHVCGAERPGEPCNQWWTGFYTTLPGLKQLSRFADARLRTAETLFSAASVSLSASDVESIAMQIESARQNCSIMQHHDAMPCTCRNFVARDYRSRLENAIEILDEVTAYSVNALSGAGSDHAKPELPIAAGALNSNDRSESEDTTNASENSLLADGTMECNRTSADLVVTNSMPWTRREVVRMLVCAGKQYDVSDSAGNSVAAQVLDLPLTACFGKESEYQLLLFQATVPPLGFTTYSVKQSSSAVGSHKTTRGEGTPPQLENDDLEASFDEYGALNTIFNKQTNQNYTVEHSYWQYVTLFDTVYVFTTGVVPPRVYGEPSNSEWIHSSGPVADALYQCRDSEIVSVYMLFQQAGNDTSMLHLDIAVPAETNNNDLVMRLNTTISNKGVLYHDSNGFQVHRRAYNTSRSIPGNYYPSTTMASIRNDASENAPELMVLMTYAHGVYTANDTSGCLEVMLNRHENVEFRGDYNMNVTARFRIVVDNTAIVAASAPRLSLLFQYPLQPVVMNDASESLPSYSMTSSDFPLAVDVTTMQVTTPKRVVMRLRHLHDAVGSNAVSVNVGELFKSSIAFSASVQVTVDGDVPLDSITRKHWTIGNDTIHYNQQLDYYMPGVDDGSVVCDFTTNPQQGLASVAIGPLAICTFDTAIDTP